MLSLIYFLCAVSVSALPHRLRGSSEWQESSFSASDVIVIAGCQSKFILINPQVLGWIEMEGFMKPLSSDVLMWDHREWQIRRRGTGGDANIRILSESSQRCTRKIALTSSGSPLFCSQFKKVTRRSSNKTPAHKQDSACGHWENRFPLAAHIFTFPVMEVLSPNFDFNC